GGQCDSGRPSQSSIVAFDRPQRNHLNATVQPYTRLMLRARPQVAGWRCRADSMNYDTILVTHHGPTAVVALNRPDKLNAMSMMLKAELVRALHDLDKHEETRTIVLTGSGDKAFTA